MAEPALPPMDAVAPSVPPARDTLAPLPARRMRRALFYPVVGAALALGAPVGLLLVRAAASGVWPSLSWAVGEFSGDAVSYVYVTLSTLIVLALAGGVVGRRSDALATRAGSDPLTGLANRARFEPRLEHELARARRYDTPVSVLLVDVDRLKPINDRWGHAAGDTALRAVADALRRTCRQTDLCARIGGDEFAVVAPSTTAAEAVELAERLRRVLATTPVQLATPPSVSVGVVDSQGALRGAEGMLRAADRALYRAKVAGRDRVAVHDDAAAHDSSETTD